MLNRDQKERESLLNRNPLHPQILPVQLATPKPVATLIISYLTLRELLNSYMFVHSSMYDLRIFFLKAPHHQIECRNIQRDLANHLIVVPREDNIFVNMRFFNLYTLNSTDQQMLQRVVSDEKKAYVRSNMSCDFSKKLIIVPFLFCLIMFVGLSVIVAKDPKDKPAIVGLIFMGIGALLAGGFPIRQACIQRSNYNILRQNIQFSSNLLTVTSGTPLLANEHKIEVLSDDDSDEENEDEDEAKSGMRSSQ